MTESRPPTQQVTIRVNGREFSVAGGMMTAAQLFTLVGVERNDLVDLFVEAPGLAEDPMLTYRDDIEVTDGMSFFTVPRAIMAG